VRALVCGALSVGVAGCASGGGSVAVVTSTPAGTATRSADPSPPSTNRVTTSAAPVTIDWKPVPLTATPDEAHAVTGPVTVAEGGELTATDAAGVVYRLTVPPGAVPADLQVTLTLLAAVAGVPGQTAAYAVDLAPAGTQLAVPARLDVVPSVPFGPNRVWIETTGSAAAPVALAGFPVRGNKGVLLTHFSGGGVVDGTTSPTTSAHASNGPRRRSRSG
jgi:hypothetical protein